MHFTQLSNSILIIQVKLFLSFLLFFYFFKNLRKVNSSSVKMLLHGLKVKLRSFALFFHSRFFEIFTSINLCYSKCLRLKSQVLENQLTSYIFA